LVKPYKDEHLNSDEWIRTFSIHRNDDSFVWHRDKRSREIQVLEGSGWLFQEEDQLPFAINKGNKLKIEKMVYHRLIKGTDDLVLRIKEID
jgi:quercetin dioxygenase-like cupin family protein